MVRQFRLLAGLGTGSPARIHGSADLFVNFVSFIIISFVCSPGKEAVLVVGVLELFQDRSLACASLQIQDLKVRNG